MRCFNSRPHFIPVSIVISAPGYWEGETRLVRLVGYEFDISKGGDYGIGYVIEFSGRFVGLKHWRRVKNVAQHGVVTGVTRQRVTSS